MALRLPSATKNTNKYIKILIFILLSSKLYADELNKSTVSPPPLYELGLFIGAANLPDYPAAEQSRNRTIPIPLIRYHGDLFRSDDKDGTRFRFVNADKLDFDLSFGGSFATETGNNLARIGMPNLDWTAEIGPRLLYYLYRNPDVAQIRIGLPIRANFATDFVKWYGVGYVFAPTLQVNRYNFIAEGLDVFISYTPSFISDGIADYFYEIKPEYQTVERSTYDGKAGFLRSEISLALKYQFKNKYIIIGAQYSDYSQSANKESYLHRSDVNWSYILAFNWILYESDKRGID